jgi:ribosomal protein L13E
MAEKTDMNALMREARGITFPEPKTKRERKQQHEEMNARLRAARGFTVEAQPQRGGVVMPENQRGLSTEVPA